MSKCIRRVGAKFYRNLSNVKLVLFTIFKVNLASLFTRLKK